MKAGRPVSPVKREVRAAIRFTRSEYFILNEKAKAAGLTASEYIRQNAINGQVKSRLTVEERQFVRQLIGFANNFNQTVKIFHTEGLYQGMQWFENYRNELDAILEKLRS